MNNKSSEIQIRCEGTSAQYWTLNLKRNGETVSVRTSKDWSYIKEIERNWLFTVKAQAWMDECK